MIKNNFVKIRCFNVRQYKFLSLQRSQDALVKYRQATKSIYRLLCMLHYRLVYCLLFYSQQNNYCLKQIYIETVLIKKSLKQCNEISICLDDDQKFVLQYIIHSHWKRSLQVQYWIQTKLLVKILHSIRARISKVSNELVLHNIMPIETLFQENP